ncbi:MAG: hypothetical protein EOO27_26310 [Comamonadaceae bacterium]|nr:MAG: hypothetical protein EOO27_26310 [Comamonadaceae bacterium]
MPELTRRRTWPDDQHAAEDWSIFYGDIGVGRIMRHQGTAQVIWRWSVGFQLGRHPRDNIAGTADSFEQAREAWAQAWAEYLPDCTEAQFEEYRGWHRFRYGGLSR